MTDDRPDYTGSIVIEDIENVTAVITVTGAVTVTGDITITNSTIAVTQSGDWNIADISGTVNVTGTVSISGGVTITGSVTITGTTDINIASSSISIDTSLTTGLRPTLIEADQVQTKNASTSTAMGSATANTDFTTFTVNYDSPKSIHIFAIIIPESGYNPTATILRDDATVVSVALTGGTSTIIEDLDENVSAGLHTYALQFDANGSVSALLGACNEDLDLTTSLVKTGVTDNLPYSTTASTTVEQSITLTETGYVYVIGLAATYGSATVLYVNRGGVTQKSWSPLANTLTEYSYLDGPLEAGTYTYTLVVLPATSNTVDLVLISDGTAEQEIYLSPYLQNLNVGLDTRAAESGGNLAAAATSLAIIDDWDSSDHCNIRHLNATDDAIVVSATNLDIRDLTATDIVSGQITKWGGTALTGRDISSDLALLQPASAIGTIADVTAAASATQLIAASTPCKGVAVVSLAANTGKIRVGDSNVSASRGVEMSKGDAVVLDVDNVNKVYVYGNAADKVSITYVN